MIPLSVMTYLKSAGVLLALFVFAFFIHSSSVVAGGTVTKCAGDPATLNWSSSNVNASGCTLIPISNANACSFNPVPDSTGSKSIDTSAVYSIASPQANSCTAQLQCGTAVDSTTLTVNSCGNVGACGTADKKTYPNGASSFGSDTLCNSNGGTTPSTVTFPTGSNYQVTWTCNGSNGAPASGQCIAYRASSGSGTTGACGTANGKTYPYGTAGPYSAVGNTQCSSGTSTNTAFPAAGQTVTWICNSTNGGASSGQCLASQASNGTVAYGACGSAATVYSATAPTTNLCSTPYGNTTVTATGNSQWAWNCLNSDGTPYIFACTTPAQTGSVQPICSATHYNCTSGFSFTAADNGTYWSWQCFDNSSGSGNEVDCREDKPVNYVICPATTVSLAQNQQQKYDAYYNAGGTLKTDCSNTSVSGTQLVSESSTWSILPNRSSNSSVSNTAGSKGLVTAASSIPSKTTNTVQGQYTVSSNTYTAHRDFNLLPQPVTLSVTITGTVAGANTSTTGVNSTLTVDYNTPWTVQLNSTNASRGCTVTLSGSTYSGGGVGLDDFGATYVGTSWSSGSHQVNGWGVVPYTFNCQDTIGNSVNGSGTVYVNTAPGVCGSANGTYRTTAPSTGLCNSPYGASAVTLVKNTYSIVTGWSWVCYDSDGAGGGYHNNAGCSANSLQHFVVCPLDGINLTPGQTQQYTAWYSATSNLLLDCSNNTTAGVEVTNNSATTWNVIDTRWAKVGNNDADGAKGLVTAISTKSGNNPVGDTVRAVYVNGSTFSNSRDFTVVAAFPDLTAGAITPTTAQDGVPTVFSATISNAWYAPTPTGFNNFMQVGTSSDGGNSISVTANLAPVAMSALPAPGSGVTKQTYIFPGAGTYYMRACADKSSPTDLGTINEGTAARENNNCGFWTAITVDQPDLIAQVIPPSINVGNNQTVTATILNQGSQNTGRSFANYIQVNSAADGGGTALTANSAVSNNPNSSGSMALLPAGGQGTASRSYNFTAPGIYSVNACADQTGLSSAGTVTESNEANNCSGWVNFTVGSGTGNPDIVCSRNPSGPSVSAGTVIFTAAVNNTTASSYTFRGSLNNILQTGASTVFSKSYPVGASDNVTATAVTAAGTLGPAQCGGAFTVGSACGSTVATITATPARIRSGSSASIQWSATNVQTQCSLEATGGDNYSGATPSNGCSLPLSGTYPSPALTQQTTYCLTCDGNAAAKKCVTVNVLPFWQIF